MHWHKNAEIAYVVFNLNCLVYLFTQVKLNKTGFNYIVLFFSFQA